MVARQRPFRDTRPQGRGACAETRQCVLLFLFSSVRVEDCSWNAFSLPCFLFCFPCPPRCFPAGIGREHERELQERGGQPACGGWQQGKGTAVSAADACEGQSRRLAMVNGMPGKTEGGTPPDHILVQHALGAVDLSPAHCHRC